jgi:indolepyruvate ferredoxin oxidoreductase
VLAEPELPALARPWSILVTGIGGTGVVTIGHILGQAAHIEGKVAALIDMVGISQKNGAVVTHVKIAARPEDISAVRVARGGADLILGCDLVTSASERILAGASRQRTHAVINEHEAMPAQFAHNADFNLLGGRMALQIAAAVRADGFHAVDATEIATALTGDSIAANLFTLGYAWQKGLVPIGAAAIEEAVRLNGVAVKMNLEAFLWGRRAAADEKAVRAVIGAKAAAKPQSLDDVIARRVAFLADYQNAAYAQSYADFVGLVRAAESALPGRRSGLGEAVAKFLFKLMAYKDEYEVARLYTDGAFAQSLKSRFTGDYKPNFHLAPPILDGDGFTGQPVKSVSGRG